MRKLSIGYNPTASSRDIQRLTFCNLSSGGSALEIQLSIKDFEKHLKRSDIKFAVWCAFDCRVLTHPDFFAITGDEFKVYFWIVSVACVVKSQHVRLNVEHTEQMLNVPKSAILATIEKLNGKRWSVQNPDEIRTESARVQDKTGQDKTAGTVRVLTVPPRSANKPSGESARKPYRMVTKEDFVAGMGGYLTAWSELYPDKEYLNAEVTKGLMWLKANPKKNLKTIRGWQAFWSGWFDRGWDKSRSRGPSGKIPEAQGWEGRAAMVKGVFKSHGPDDQDAIQHKLGAELYQLVCKAGSSTIRGLPDNAFYIKTVAGMLRAASERGS